MLHLGHPMVGDPTYGPVFVDRINAVHAGDRVRDLTAVDKRAGRLLLHAHRLVLPLQLTLPEHYKEPLDVTARPPPDFADFGVVLEASPLNVVAGPS